MSITASVIVAIGVASRGVQFPLRGKRKSMFFCTVPRSGHVIVVDIHTHCVVYLFLSSLMFACQD